MPKRVEYFSENEVAFILCLGEPTGGASLSVAEAYVVLQNDIGEDYSCSFNQFGTISHFDGTVDRCVINVIGRIRVVVHLISSYL